MRVIAGSARSLPLKAPEGLETRPTADRIKETLFNMLQTDVPGCVFVDLFSGTGGIGIEALSRGARKAYFVENAARAAACIQQNLAFTKLQERAVLLKQDACSALGGIREEQVDIIFMDPPYDCGEEKAALAVLGRMPYVTEKSYVTQDTLIVVESSLKTDFSWLEETGFRILEKKGKPVEKHYRTNKHVFIKRTPL